MSKLDSDTLQRFVFEKHQVRGELVHLGASFQAAQGQSDYPAALVAELGKTLTASVLLGATIKYQGSLIIQIQSAGPIQLLVAQCTNQRHIRGLARWDGELAAGPIADTYGQGQITITVNADKHQDRYQGIVALQGEQLSHALENYFNQSEQLPTRLFLFANQEQAVGLLLQRLPGEAQQDDLWHRVGVLAETISADEMLGLDNSEILHRLFNEEDIRLFEREPVSFRCTCSREKIESMILSLGRDEAQHIVEEQGQIEVDCEFCNQHYHFDKVDVEQLFTHPAAPPASDSLH